MKIQSQIIGLGAIGAVFVLMVGGVGWQATQSVQESQLQTLISGEVRSQGQQMATLLDSIRADAQMAVFAGRQRNPDRMEEAEKGFGAHSQMLRVVREQLQSGSAQGLALEQLKEVSPLVDQYVRQAQEIVGQALTDTPRAESELGGLYASYQALVAPMNRVGQEMAQSAAAQVAHSQAAVQVAQNVVVIALVAGALMLVLASVWLAWQIKRPMGHAVEVADRLAHGDLSVQVRSLGSDEFVHLFASLHRTVAGLSDMVLRVQRSSEQVATASAEIAQGNNDLSARTEQQAAALEQTSASMAELGGAVSQNADSAQQANQLAQSASSIAIKGGEIVNQVVATMRDINASSSKIGDIISVIDGIAFQTNILALNAAVEAARAGEQGRGFAVVASEVRALAGRSAEAAKEIKTLITDSVEKVESGTGLVDQAGITMTEIVNSIRRVTDIMGEISVASSEQSLDVKQVGEAAAQMEQGTQQNAALVEEMAAAASSLRIQAHELVQVVAAFKVGTGHFR